MTTKNILLRLPPDVADALDAEVAALHQKRNTYVVNVLRDVLAPRIAAMKAAPGSDDVPLFDVDRQADQ